MVIYEGIAHDTGGLVYLISSGRKGDLMALDPNTKKRRKIRYASNQTTIFTEDQLGQSKLPALMLKDGIMVVDDTDETLIQFMDVHPLNGSKFKRVDEEADAAEELESDEVITNIKAAIFAKNKQKDGSIALESLLSIKSKTLSFAEIQELGPAQIRQKLYALANSSPDEFLNDKGEVNCFESKDFIFKDIVLRSMAEGVLKMNSKQTEISWANGEIIIKIPKGKDYVEFFANFLQSKDGMTVMKQVADELDID